LTLSTGPDRPLLRAFATLAGGETLAWMSRLLGLAGAEELSALAETAEPGAGGVRMLPYLSPAGERAPFVDPAARGALVGLTLDHSPAQLARAAFEGMAAAVADCLAATGSPAREVRVCGGGARSALWCQLIADMTGAPVLRAPAGEAGARGAAAFAASVLGDAPDLAAAARRDETDFLRVEPDPRRGPATTGALTLLRELRAASRDTWQLLASAADPTPGSSNA
ncbi:MAG: FGGY-family carbohydrate kinase, partial [Actinocatenispora sp.]